MLFYVYNHEKGDDDRVSNFLLEHIYEDIEKRKKAPSVPMVPVCSEPFPEMQA